MDTRRRIFITTILTSFLFFLIAGPVVNLVISFILPPAKVTGLDYLKRNNEVILNWDSNLDYDLAGYEITLNDTIVQNLNLTATSTTAQLYDLQQGDNKLTINAIDNGGRKSETLEFNIVIDQEIKSEEIVSNRIMNVYQEKMLYIILFSLCFFGLITWSLFYKYTTRSLLLINTFPVFVILPYLFLVISINESFFSLQSKLIFSSASTLGAGMLIYLICLTVNILNGSIVLKNSLPLEQAAKAAQFIFTLISSYVLFIFIYVTNQNLVIKLISVLIFTTFLTLSCFESIKEVSVNQKLLRSVTISFVLILAMLLLSIWPVEGVYVVLSISIFYYILLNTALEIRNRISKNLYIEFTVLIVLIAFTLLTNAIWGIRGTII